MFNHRFTLFHLAGIEIKADATWLVLALLVVTSLAVGWFPAAAQGLPRSSYIFMAVVGAAGLFFSIVAHEFCHALVGRAYKMNIREISLFLFGGVAHLEDEPPSPRAEMQMAIAGPAMSLVLAMCFYGLQHVTRDSAPLIPALFSYLYSINVVVAFFNMMPGYPLDGGRVLRAVLWKLKGDIRWATKIASVIGQVFGGGIVLLGVLAFISGDPLSGIWAFFLGLLLASFARASYVQLLVHQAFHGKQAAIFMNPRPLTVTPDTRLSDLFTNSLYNMTDESMVPVVSSQDERAVIGCVDLREAKELPEERRTKAQVGEVMRACTAEMRIEPETDAESALTKMSRSGNRLLLVIKDNRLLGVLSQNALVRYLSLSGT
jgi:Zn-dependent protease